MVDAEQNFIIQAPVIPVNKCDLCHKKHVEWKCLICDEVMCENCKIVHLRSKVSKDHKVVAIVRPSDGIRKCTEHPAEDLQMFCISCDILVCRKCITSSSPSHRSHPFELIEDMVDNKKTELLEITVKSKEKLDRYKQIVKLVDKKQRKFSDKISNTVAKVLKRNKDLKDKLDNVTNDLINQLQELAAQKQSESETLESQLQADIKELRELIEQCEKEQKVRRMDIDKFVAEQKRRLSRFTTTGPPNRESPPEFVSRNVEREIEALFGELVKSEDSQSSWREKEKNAVVVDRFSARENTHVASAGDGQALIWKRSGKCISLVSPNSDSEQNMKTDFQVYDAAVTKDGLLLVTEWKLFGGKLHVYTANRGFNYVYATKFYRTTGMTVTDNGNVIIDLYSGVGSKLVEITRRGNEIRSIQYDKDKTKLFSDPCSISQNINGDIAVVDSDKKAVVVVDRNERKKFTYDGKIGSLKQPFDPQSVVTDKRGHILISDVANSVVHVLDKDGCFLKFLISEKDGCDRPVGLCIDTKGRLWVVNTGNNSVMIIKYAEDIHQDTFVQYRALKSKKVGINRKRILPYFHI